MLSDKLVTLLRTFEKVDLNRLRKLVASPYFNDEPDALRLFDICHAALKKSPEALSKLTKEQVWKKLCPALPYDDAHLRRMTSDLNQLAIKFRALEQREREPLEDWLFEQKALEAAGLDKHLAGIERQITRHIEHSTARNTEFYHLAFRYHWNIFNRSYRVVAATDYMAKLLPANKALESFYVTQKLKMYVAWLSYRQFRSTDKVLPLPPGFWENIDQEGFSDIPMIGIYRQVVQILTEPDDESLFEGLLTDLERMGNALAPEDYRECCYIAQNYCALKINQGKSEYYGKAFVIFKTMVERDVLLEEGQLAEGVYKNIITTGLRADAFVWVENFIEEYSWYLPPAIRENARTFNLANLYSHLKQYNRALEVLRNVEYSDVTYALGAKTILLRIYYEQNEYLALDSLIDSFRIYLRRNKQISKNLQKEYNNFLNLVKKLTTLRVGDKKALSEFRTKVVATSYNTPKKWLLAKILELER
jgi:hypothetical protein